MKGCRRTVWVVFVIVVLGGCSALGVGVGDEVEPVLVTAAEKERLGYERPEGVPNADVQRRAMEHREEIFAVVKSHVEGVLGREVEMVGIDARYPYDAVNVLYRTTSEPVVASHAFVGLDSDGGLSSPSSIEKIEPLEIENRTVMGLFYMAYREEIAAMVDYLREAYPQYTGRLAGAARWESMVRPDIVFNFHHTFEGEPPYNMDLQAASAAIFAEYRADPTRTDREWREVFDAHASDAQYHVAISMTLKDPGGSPTEALAREVGDDVRSNVLFEVFDSWAVGVIGNLVMRDGEHNHEEYWVMVDSLSPTWSVLHWIDGYTF